ncbi:MAG: adenylyl-sulfate kinase, partial [Xanthomonadales bacterium]|nr:adenylyl-sulfate kinase [Xanthomonadales bacterium]
LLDGDIVRKNLSSELGFSKEHRDLSSEEQTSEPQSEVCSSDLRSPPALLPVPSGSMRRASRPARAASSPRWRKARRAQTAS